MISNPEDERKFTEALLSENWSFFTVPGRMEAWCHGSPGIGLSRLRAYERMLALALERLEALRRATRLPRATCGARQSRS